MDGRANGWTAAARRDAPIVIQIAAAYKRRQKFAVERDASENERSPERASFVLEMPILRDAFPFSLLIREPTKSV